MKVCFLFFCTWIETFEQFEECTGFRNFAEFNTESLELMKLEKIFRKKNTSTIISLGFMILFLMRDLINTQTNLTNLFCCILSYSMRIQKILKCTLFFSSQWEMQFVMYKVKNSLGRSAELTSLLTTSIDAKVNSI